MIVKGLMWLFVWLVAGVCFGLLIGCVFLFKVGVWVCVDLVVVSTVCLASVGLGFVVVVLVMGCSFVRLFCF